MGYLYRWLLLLCLISTAASAVVPDVLVQQGKLIYRDGILPSGQPLKAVLHGGGMLLGRQAACATCHRRSGIGSAEGGKTILPVAGPLLYQPRQARFRDRFQRGAVGLLSRPAYTDAALATALRTGVDTAGRTLAEPMPRYALGDLEIKALLAYLKTLQPDAAPGVAADAVHFATVVTQGVAAAERDAVLGVLEAYTRDKNAGTRLETQRAKRAPWTKSRLYPAYREWKLHVWVLKGAEETWPAQLERYYRERPVFALISGLSERGWRPVHEFCEEFELPCLFPDVDLPVISDSDFYTLYFSKGLTLEAEALGIYLRDSYRPPLEVVQVLRREPGSVPAEALRRSLIGSAINVRDVVIEGGKPTGKLFWEALLQREQPQVLVLWLDAQDIGELHSIGSPWPQQVYLSSSLAGDGLAGLAAGMRERVRLAHPFALPQQNTRALSRATAWMHARGIAVTHPRAQANAFFAATTAAEAMKHIIDNFSREYFIERIEHMLVNATFSSVYPRVSLGPGQRFASKGCYIVKLGGGKQAELLPVSDWIVP